MGNRATRLNIKRQLNNTPARDQAVIDFLGFNTRNPFFGVNPITRGSQPRPYPHFGNVTLNGDVSGWTMQLSYTWSRTLLTRARMKASRGWIGHLGTAVRPRPEIWFADAQGGGFRRWRLAVGRVVVPIYRTRFIAVQVPAVGCKRDEVPYKVSYESTWAQPSVRGTPGFQHFADAPAIMASVVEGHVLVDCKQAGS